MSTRDDILAALTDNPDGLTLKEIAAACPSCEFCEITVGSLLATMKREDVLHTNGFRDGQSLYFFGKRPSGPESLPYTPSPAARAIAAMRTRPAAGQVSRSADSSTAETTLAPAQPAGNQEQPMSIKDKIAAALKAGGPMTLVQIRERVKVEAASVYVSQMVNAGLLKKLGGGRGSTIYGLPEQTLRVLKVAGDALERGAELGRRVTPQKGHGRKATRRRTSRNGASAAAAAPAPAPHINGNGAHFAINEHGELGIDKGDTKVKLDADEFTRLRGFIERTQPVWKGARA